jgi:hypothetical protein
MYDSDSGAVTTALQGSSTAIFTDDTISKILALTTTTGSSTVQIDSAAPDANGNVTVAAGAEVVLVATSDTTQTTVHAPVNAPVVIFQGKGGVIATIDDGATTVPAHAAGVVDRVVVGTAGNDQIVVADAKNTQITLGTGNSTVHTGAGHDTVVAGLGNSTVAGGTGHAIVAMKGNASDYAVTVQNGHAVVTGGANHTTTDISNIQYVQLDSGKALVFARDSTDAAVATLYHTAFGRDADAGGLQYWFDLAHAGASMKQIADAFTHSAEFASQSALSDTDFVQGLYQHTFGRAGEDAGVAYWTDAISHGETRADLIAQFSQLAAQNIAHDAPNQEAQVIGSVTIVTGIV